MQPFTLMFAFFYTWANINESLCLLHAVTYYYSPPLFTSTLPQNNVAAAANGMAQSPRGHAFNVLFMSYLICCLMTLTALLFMQTLMVSGRNLRSNVDVISRENKRLVVPKVNVLWCLTEESLSLSLASKDRIWLRPLEVKCIIRGASKRDTPHPSLFHAILYYCIIFTCSAALKKWISSYSELSDSFPSLVPSSSLPGSRGGCCSLSQVHVGDSRAHLCQQVQYLVGGHLGSGLKVLW